MHGQVCIFTQRACTSVLMKDVVRTILPSYGPHQYPMHVTRPPQTHLSGPPLNLCGDVLHQAVDEGRPMVHHIHVTVPRNNLHVRGARGCNLTQ